MLPKRWFSYLAAVITVVLLFANIQHFLNREWESSFFPTSYATLYYPLDVPTIRTWSVLDRDRIQLNLAGTRDRREWRIIGPDGKEQTAYGMQPDFRIDTTFSVLHSYRLVPVEAEGGPAVEVSFRFYSREFYGSLGMQHPDVYIVRSNVPCGEFDQLSVNDWVDDYRYVGAAGLAEADLMVREEIGVLPDDPSLTRLEKISRFLRKKLKNAGGVPKDEERWMNPYVLYTEMVNGRAKGWCTQHAQVLVFWANRAGVPTRFVFGARTEENTIVYTGHAWAESYIREQHRWAFVDLSQNQVYITDKRGMVLSSADLFHLNQYGAFDSVSVRVYAVGDNRFDIAGTDTFVTVPFAQCNAFLRDEFTPHSILKYRRPPNVEDVRDDYSGFMADRTFLLGNLERYLFKPQLAYSLYPTEGEKTYLVRRLLFFGMIASFLVWLVSLLTAKTKKSFAHE
jgi:hypothetical protein